MVRDQRSGVHLSGANDLTELDVLELCCRTYNLMTPGARVLAPAPPLVTPVVLLHGAHAAVRLDHTTVWRAHETRSEFEIDLAHCDTTLEISIAYDRAGDFSARVCDVVGFDAIARGPRRSTCEDALNRLLDVAYPWPYVLRGKWLYLC